MCADKYATIREMHARWLFTFTLSNYYEIRRSAILIRTCRTIPSIRFHHDPESRLVHRRRIRPLAPGKGRTRLHDADGVDVQLVRGADL